VLSFDMNGGKRGNFSCNEPFVNEWMKRLKIQYFFIYSRALSFGTLRHPGEYRKLNFNLIPFVIVTATSQVLFIHYTWLLLIIIKYLFTAIIILISSSTCHL
jgi:hypothetical protein